MAEALAGLAEKLKKLHLKNPPKP